MSTRKDIMTLGVLLNILTPEPDKYKNDLIHPSVLYIPNGFAGRKWWMVATPYYNRNSSIENPILYYGVEKEDGTPPTEWIAVGVVEDTPSRGYNSDGCLYFDGVKLWIFWRENNTQDTVDAGYKRATFGVSTTDGLTFSQKKLFAGELTGEGDTYKEDSEMCPIITDMNGKLQLYGCHYEFEPNKQPRGLAIWDIENNDLENKAFTRTKTVGQLYYRGFNFWHFDIFRHDNKFYCVVTPEKGDEILLGVSDDAENFKFWSTPLLSTAVSGAEYMYKPCARVIDGTFYLWHPVKVNGVNKIHMSQMNFTQLLSSLNETVSSIS